MPRVEGSKRGQSHVNIDVLTEKDEEILRYYGVEYGALNSELQRVALRAVREIQSNAKNKATATRNLLGLAVELELDE